MRKWVKWVAEIREPNKRSQIWLGSYTTPVAAARAYDTTVFYLRCPYTRLNFPKLVFQEDGQQLHNMSAASIRKKATEVEAKVDAFETAHRSPISQPKTTHRYYGIGVVLFRITWRFLILPRRDILNNCFTIASWFFIVTLL
ncbi:hypothetical protein L3X38_033466 [Prunus dulcis]|uniref:AP2/ERF domain-containing protein n=1 Tax=Prunus dulcis TaxID=3755 RepID=A0AAD4VG84_PRUDU|nr:hypothetical protein L3X38_033466 [Prunus dulcis]